MKGSGLKENWMKGFILKGFFSEGQLKEGTHSDSPIFLQAWNVRRMRTTSTSPSAKATSSILPLVPWTSRPPARIPTYCTSKWLMPKTPRLGCKWPNVFTFGTWTLEDTIGECGEWFTKGILCSLSEYPTQITRKIINSNSYTMFENPLKMSHFVKHCERSELLLSQCGKSKYRKNVNFEKCEFR